MYSIMKLSTGGPMDKDQLHALLYDALETEKGGLQVYEMALHCAINDDLIEEWQEYLEQTRNHIGVLLEVFKTLGLNPDQESPARNVVRLSGQSLIKIMEVALSIGKPAAAQIVAAECVVTAETKDHMNWELLSVAAKALGGFEQKTIMSAVEQVEDEEDEHLYHSTGWARELHVEALGLQAELPPAEEKADVKTEEAAAAVRKDRKEKLTAPKRKRTA
jgi:ferritin-like metal-binding protein YciE